MVQHPDTRTANNKNMAYLSMKKLKRGDIVMIGASSKKQQQLQQSPLPAVSEENVQHQEHQEQLVQEPPPDMGAPPPSLTSSVKPKRRLIGDLRRRFNWKAAREKANNPKEAEIALASAALYMAPVTQKIASHLKVTWEPEVAMILKQLDRVSNPSRPLMVGVVGIPGSGKSTSCDIVASLLGEDKAIVMPMDGYHFSMKELELFPNPSEAIYRRGAPDTFNPMALDHDLDRIAYGDEPEVSIPGFDHAKGDPTANQHTFKRDKHSIVICEGLYLLHDADGWENIQRFFDWTIYIAADVDGCIERLKERNKCIPGYTPEEIDIRCDAVDRVNAMTAEQGARKYASQIVQSGATL